MKTRPVSQLIDLEAGKQGDLCPFVHTYIFSPRTVRFEDDEGKSRAGTIVRMGPVRALVEVEIGYEKVTFDVPIDRLDPIDDEAELLIALNKKTYQASRNGRRHGQ